MWYCWKILIQNSQFKSISPTVSRSNLRAAIPRIGVSSGDVSFSRIEQKRLAHLMRIFAVDLPDYQYHDDDSPFSLHFNYYFGNRFVEASRLPSTRRDATRSPTFRRRPGRFLETVDFLAYPSGTPKSNDFGGENQLTHLPCKSVSSTV